jgi:hypothetical protein
LVVYVVLGATPINRIPVNVNRSNGFQRSTVTLAHCALKPGDEYLAGVDMVVTRRQAIGALRWIDEPRASFIRRMDATGLAAIVDSLAQSQVKVVIDNYRLQALPPEIRSHLDLEFGYYWGNLLIYGPVIDPGERDVYLRFSGPYIAAMEPGAMLTIDGIGVAADGEVHLDRGIHRIASSHSLRLRLQVPECEVAADPRYREPANLFPNVYGY